jgi:hypothetical protein
MDKFDFTGDDERDPLSDGFIRDTYIRCERWDEAASLCQDMDAIKGDVLTDQGADKLKAALRPGHLTIEWDGCGWWNVIDVELATPDVTELIAAKDWHALAAQMLDGAIISDAIMSGWQAAHVAAAMGDAATVEKRGHAWEARRIEFAQEGAA